MCVANAWDSVPVVTEKMRQKRIKVRDMREVSLAPLASPAPSLLPTRMLAATLTPRGSWKTTHV